MAGSICCFIRVIMMIRVTRSKMDYTTRNNVRNNISVCVFLGVLFAKEQSSGGAQHVGSKSPLCSSVCSL
ncbi:hypothetical protein BRADI_5g27414v3 [Brachypodium distachyon]|uniref:Uncharacterized protein n=1 Tax=Brachypodium distachyon TaxID=15368 RepID=A0A0Q3ECR7_BRADI|nr:hypothetical protein BRADI_5g27414v3 [Brachypodium distachyon]